MAALQDGRDGVVSVGAHSVRPQRLVFHLLCGARRLGAPFGRVSPCEKERFGSWIEFVSCYPVGRGLKVNRPKAERSHPGVCPRRLFIQRPQGEFRRQR